MYDILIRDATLVTSAGRQVADVAIQGGRVAYVGPRPPHRRTKEEISAIGRFVIPGVVDVAGDLFTHGLEGWGAESAAALGGGVTTVIAHTPTVVDKASAKKALEAISAKSYVDFGLWVDAGASAKAVDAVTADLALGATLRISEGSDADSLAALGAKAGLLGVILDVPTGRVATLAELTALPAVAALRDLARERRFRAHVLHLSSSAELAMLDPVRGDHGATCSVTPHHLTFADDANLGERGATHPPLRPENDRRALWTALKRGRIDAVASDHRVAGLPSAELVLPLMLAAVRFGRISMEMLVQVLCEQPARLLGLENKGRLAAGADADLVLFSESDTAKVDPAQLTSTAGYSPYGDRDIGAKPEIVIAGGKVVARRGKIVAEPTARRVTRATAAVR